MKTTNKETRKTFKPIGFLDNFYTVAPIKAKGPDAMVSVVKIQKNIIVPVAISLCPAMERLTPIIAPIIISVTSAPREEKKMIRAVVYFISHLLEINFHSTSLLINKF